MRDYSLTPRERKTWLAFVCNDRCQDLDMHEHFAAGGAFRWRWPKLTVLHAAHRRTGMGLNRYPHNVIGAFVLVRGRGLGVTWKAA